MRSLEELSHSSGNETTNYHSSLVFTIKLALTIHGLLVIFARKTGVWKLVEGFL